MTSPKPSPKSKADSKPNGETFRLLFANHPIPMWIYDLGTLAFLDVNVLGQLAGGLKSRAKPAKAVRLQFIYQSMRRKHEIDPKVSKYFEKSKSRLK